MQSLNIVDLTAANFQQVIMETSQTRLVVVGFWTARDQSCDALMDDLASVVGEYPEDALLARVDVDSQSEVAMRFGIQSVPTVALIKGAQPIDSFVGARDLNQIKAFIEPHLPQLDQMLIMRSLTSLEKGDFSAAFGFAKQALDINPDSVEGRLVYADCCIRNGKVSDAEVELQVIEQQVQTDTEQLAYHQRLLAAIEQLQQAAQSPQIVALRQQLIEQPDDLAIRVLLATELSQVKQIEEALALLFSVLKKDLHFEQAKPVFLEIMATLPERDPLAVDYRRKMYSLMY